MSELLQSLGPLAGIAPLVVLPAIALFTRMSLLVFLLPGLGTRAIPVRVRLIAALAVTALLFPAVAPLVEEGPVLPLLAGEALVGAFLGFGFRVLVFALSIAGTIVAQALSLSQIFGAGISEDSSTTVSTLLTLAGAALFLTADLHIAAFGILLDSYRTFPPGGYEGASGPIAQAALSACADAFAFGLSLALPLVLLNLAYNALLGVLNRAMPQLMVTFVGMPAITFGGIALLTAAVGGMLIVWMDRAQALFGSVLP
ncbi:flagellar biosynthetic protein FliR [Parvularcula oceani]|uniref:flagellar biosynthetic protein FliR n=1 Tax=Parvularcula oceani TaxID=1247963 RepID=UPI00068F02A3|nr:flagellar biosynthetic protein FliR [Parvularcula oceani]